MFNVIYADPPWFYNDRHLASRTKSGAKTRFGLGAAGRYNVMKTEDICSIPVQDITADNCALFLWTTFPQLDAGLEVMKAWGFDYKTIGFLWIKLNPRRARGRHTWIGNGIDFMHYLSFFGIGYYTKHNPEPCLLGIKGKMKPVSNKVSNLIYAPKGGHSTKPEIVRTKIEELFGDVPRVELFARDTVPGWTALGNEIDGKDIREAIKDVTK